MLTDNAPEFKNESLKNWLQSQGSPSYHPRANESAERAVPKVKAAFVMWDPHMGQFGNYLDRILFNLRNTYRANSGKTPAQLLMNRNLRQI